MKTQKCQSSTQTDIVTYKDAATTTDDFVAEPRKRDSVLNISIPLDIIESSFSRAMTRVDEKSFGARDLVWLVRNDRTSSCLDLVNDRMGGEDEVSFSFKKVQSNGRDETLDTRTPSSQDQQDLPGIVDRINCEYNSEYVSNLYNTVPFNCDDSSIPPRNLEEDEFWSFSDGDDSDERRSSTSLSEHLNPSTFPEYDEMEVPLEEEQPRYATRSTGRINDVATWTIPKRPLEYKPYVRRN